MKQVAVSWLFALLVASCSGSSSKNEEAGVKQIYWPAKDVAEETDSAWNGMALGEDERAMGTGKWQQEIWLNFDGATVTADQSFIVEQAGKDSVAIPAFQPADLGASFANADPAETKVAIVNAIKAILSGLDVTIAVEKPTSTTYSAVQIGGENFTGRPDVLGVAPIDIGNFVSDDVVFAFSRSVGVSENADNIQILANIAAHEIAHSLGARHLESDTALMSPSVGVTNAVVDIAANYPGEEAGENTKGALGANVGLKDIKTDPDSLPKLEDLGMSSTDDVAQISVISAANLTANPALRLVDYVYKWELAGLTLAGPSIRVRFADGEKVPVTITVSHPDAKETATFAFDVNRVLKK